MLYSDLIILDFRLCVLYMKLSYVIDILESLLIVVKIINVHDTTDKIRAKHCQHIESDLIEYHFISS